MMMRRQRRAALGVLLLHAARFATGAIEVLSWEPRILVHRGLVNDAELAHLKATAAGRYETSLIAGMDGQAQQRSSASFYLPRAEEASDAVVAGVLKRAHAAVGLPPRNGQRIQITRYDVGDKYTFHIDDDGSVGRIATVLVYVQAPGAGGETIFPFVRGANSTAAAPLPKPVELEKLLVRGDLDAYCASEQHLKVAPTPGDVLVFYPLTPGLRPDYRTWHASCPVLADPPKIIAQRWIQMAAPASLPLDWLDDSGATERFCPKQKMPAGEFNCDEAAFAGFTCTALKKDGYDCAGCACALRS